MTYNIKKNMTKITEKYFCPYIFPGVFILY